MTQLQWQTKYSPTRRQSDREGERAEGGEREGEGLALGHIKFDCQAATLGCKTSIWRNAEGHTTYTHTQIYIGTHCQVENFLLTCGNTDAQNQGDHAKSSCSFNLLLNKAAAKVTQ